MLISSSKTDFTTSVEKALSEIDPRFKEYHGVVITGSHAPEDVDSKIEMIRVARETNTPLLGLCMGLQLMLIEYARNVLGKSTATTEEIGSGEPVIIKMPELRVGMKKVGDRMESHWHNYKFNPLYTFDYRKDWKLVFEDEVLEIAKYMQHPFYLGVQYHPEYQSVKKDPHPILVEFIKHARQATMAM